MVYLVFVRLGRFLRRYRTSLITLQPTFDCSRVVPAPSSGSFHSCEFLLVAPKYRFIMMIEQRKNQRFELRFPLQLVGSGTNEQTARETKNISSSGVLFTSAEPVPLGELIEYVITFPKAPGTPNQVQIRCLGRVLREEANSTFATTLERYEFVRHPAGHDSVASQPKYCWR